MRRRKGQSPSRRSCGELPPVCLCTPAQEPEVRLASVSKRSMSSLTSVLEPSSNCYVNAMQQSVTVTAVKSSSLTAVITALHVTCKENPFMKCPPPVFRPFKTISPFLCGRCVLKMDHHCPWYVSCSVATYNRIIHMALISTLL